MSADIQKRFESGGAEVVNMTPQDFAKFIRAETAKWSKVVRETKIEAQ